MQSPNVVSSDVPYAVEKMPPRSAKMSGNCLIPQETIFVKKKSVSSGKRRMNCYWISWLLRNQLKLMTDPNSVALVNDQQHTACYHVWPNGTLCGSVNAIAPRLPSPSSVVNSSSYGVNNLHYTCVWSMPYKTSVSGMPTAKNPRNGQQFAIYSNSKILTRGCKEWVTA